MSNIRCWSFPLVLAVGFLGLVPIGCGGPRLVHDEWEPGVPKRHGIVIIMNKQANGIIGTQPVQRKPLGHGFMINKTARGRGGIQTDALNRVVITKARALI